MIPKYPKNEEIIALLEKVHTKGVPDWTAQEQIDAYKAIQALMFYWFRKEVPDAK